jgi:hypothetical protein
MRRLSLVLLFFAAGCTAEDPGTVPILTDASHDHYHVHAADASHDHDHNGAKLGHNHTHQHD